MQFVTPSFMLASETGQRSLSPRGAATLFCCFYKPSGCSSWKFMSPTPRFGRGCLVLFGVSNILLCHPDFVILTFE